MPDAPGLLPPADPVSSRQFVIAVKRLADALGYGTDRSPFLGSGLEYVQSRPYVPGDPVKSVDWRVTARTGRIFVKEYEAPKRMPVLLLVDTSASMTVSSGPLSKYAWAVRIAGGLAFAALDRMSPVGLVGAGDRELAVEPSLSRDQVYQWLFRLRRFRFDEATTLSARLMELCSVLPHRAFLVVLSDLHDPRAASALKLAAQKHDAAVVQLQDPAERGLPGAGLFRAREAETGRDFVTHGGRAWLGQAALERDLKRARVDHLLLPLDRPLLHKLVRFFRLRDKLGKGTR